MGNHASSKDGFTAQREEISKKVAMLEAQQKSYLKNVYEDKRRSHQRQDQIPSTNSSSSRLKEEKALFSWFGCIDGNIYTTSDTGRHSESPINSFKEVNWLEQLINDLSGINKAIDETNNWSIDMQAKLEQFRSSDLTMCEMKYQQKCDQDHLFLRIKAIEQEIRVEQTSDSRWPRQFKRANMHSEFESFMESSLQNSQENRNKSNNQEKQWKSPQLLLSKIHLERQSSCPSNQGSTGKWEDMDFEECMKIKSYYQRLINNHLDNEIFDSDIQLFTEKNEVIVVSNRSIYSQSIQHSSLRSKTAGNESKLRLNYQTRTVGSSFGGDMNYRQRDRDFIMGQIQSQVKMLDALSFSVKTREFLKESISSNRKNLLNKILRYFIQMFLDDYREKGRNRRGKKGNRNVDEQLKSSSFHENNNNERSNHNSISHSEGGDCGQDDGQGQKQEEVQQKGNINNNNTNNSRKHNLNLNNSDNWSLLLRESTNDDLLNEQTMSCFYSQLRSFVGIFVDVIKNYYDIPFIREKFDNSGFLTDEILHNLAANICFETVVNSVTIYGFQLEVAIQMKQLVYSNFKKKFQFLKQMEPEFFKVKDQFCLNHLTSQCILKRTAIKQLQGNQDVAREIQKEKDRNKDVDEQIEKVNCQNINGDASYLKTENDLEKEEVEVKEKEDKNQPTSQRLVDDFIRISYVNERKLERIRLSQISNFLVVSKQNQGIDEEEEDDDEHVLEEDEEEEEQQQQQKQLIEDKDTQKNGLVNFRDSNYQDYNINIPRKQQQRQQKVSKQSQQIPYWKCIEYLQRVQSEPKPMGKLRLIVKAFEIIPSCVQRFYNEVGSSEKVKMGPEDMMDIAVYVVARSQQYQLIHDIELIRQFIVPSAECSEKTGYYLLTLDAAFNYLIDTKFDRESQYSRLSLGNSFRSYQNTAER